MSAKEWLDKNKVELSKYHGNVGDYEGNICIEQNNGDWLFWGTDGTIETIKAENR
jgi:hypothetical protein